MHQMNRKTNPSLGNDGMNPRKAPEKAPSFGGKTNTHLPRAAKLDRTQALHSGTQKNLTKKIAIKEPTGAVQFGAQSSYQRDAHV